MIKTTGTSTRMLVCWTLTCQLNLVVAVDKNVVLCRRHEWIWTRLSTLIKLHVGASWIMASRSSVEFPVKVTVISAPFEQL